MLVVYTTGQEARDMGIGPLGVCDFNTRERGEILGWFAVGESKVRDPPFNST